jgi:hypothetical protein
MESIIKFAGDIFKTNIEKIFLSYETVILKENQFLVEKDKTFELWENIKGKEYLLKRFRKKSVIGIC